MNEAAYSVNMKPHKGYEAPMLTIRADTAAELSDRLKAVEEAALLADIGRIAKVFESTFQFGHKLGAEPINPPAEEEPAAKPATKKAPAKKKAEPKEEAPEEVEAPAEETVEEPAPEKPAAARTKPPAKKWKRA